MFIGRKGSDICRIRWLFHGFHRFVLDSLRRQRGSCGSANWRDLPNTAMGTPRTRPRGQMRRRHIEENFRNADLDIRHKGDLKGKKKRSRCRHTHQSKCRRDLWPNRMQAKRGMDSKVLFWTINIHQRVDVDMPVQFRGSASSLSSSPNVSHS